MTAYPPDWDADSLPHASASTADVPGSRLAELLCTRLCHDLIGPVGALNNGAEFLREEGGGEMLDQAIDLIESSAREAVARLQFYRMAYGKVKANGEADIGELKEMTQRYLHSSTITLDWPDIHTHAAGVPVSRRLAKILLNLMIVACGSLIRGGTMAVRLNHGEQADRLLVTATGRGARLEDEVLRALMSKLPVAEVSPRSVQAYLTARWAGDVGVRLETDITEDSVSLMMVRTRADT